MQCTVSPCVDGRGRPVRAQKPLMRVGVSPGAMNSGASGSIRAVNGVASEAPARSAAAGASHRVAR